MLSPQVGQTETAAGPPSHALMQALKLMTSVCRKPKPFLRKELQSNCSDFYLAWLVSIMNTRGLGVFHDLPSGSFLALRFVLRLIGTRGKDAQVQFKIAMDTKQRQRLLPLTGSSHSSNGCIPGGGVRANALLEGKR